MEGKMQGAGWEDEHGIWHEGMTNHRPECESRELCEVGFRQEKHFG